MPILDAALAFAITMLLVATAATQIVNVMRKTANLRSKQMKELLEECFNNEVLPVIELETKKLGKAIDEKVVSGLQSAATNFKDENLLAAVKDENLTWISTEQFVESMKRTELGQKLLEGLGDKADSVLDQLGKRYEAVGRKFSDSFKKYARKWATYVALGLALVVNVDSVHVIQSYLTNPALAAQVAARADDIVTEYESKLAALDTEDGDVTVEELKQSFADARAEIDALQNSELPVGWNEWPHAELLLPAAEEGGTPKLNAAVFSDPRFFPWILGVLLTGLLAGLGSPFWYETVRGISRFAQRTGGPTNKEGQT